MVYILNTEIQDKKVTKIALQNIFGIGKLNSIKIQGKVPAVLHNADGNSTVIEGNEIEIEKVVKLAGKHHPVSLSIDGKKQLSIIKDIDFDPKKHKLRHVVFGSIRSDEKVETEVPIVLEGDSEAEKKSLLESNRELKETFMLMKEEFEKTPKRNIKRFKYV